jgi:hypothetical protein
MGVWCLSSLCKLSFHVWHFAILSAPPPPQAKPRYRMIPTSLQRQRPAALGVMEAATVQQGPPLAHPPRCNSLQRRRSFQAAH